MASKKENFRLMAFRGYVCDKCIRLRGRLIKENNLTPASDKDSVWTNLSNIRKRFWVKGIGKAKGRLFTLGRCIEFETNKKGYFEIDYELKDSLFVERIWNEFKIVFPDLDLNYYEEEGIISPPINAEFGIISDIDDTVVHSNVKNKFKLFFKAMISNAFSKRAIRGTSRLFNALARGKNGIPNPVFYVSRSPMQLYDVLEDFFDLNNFPRGPVLLRNLNKEADKSLVAHKKIQKYNIISRIFDDIPNLPFILIGDSSEKDAMIYLQIAEDFPGRVKQIFIRLVDDNDKEELLRKHIEGFVHKDKVLFFRQYKHLQTELTTLKII